MESKFHIPIDRETGPNFETLLDASNTNESMTKKSSSRRKTLGKSMKERSGHPGCGADNGSKSIKKRSLKENIGHWTSEEEEQFIKAVNLYGNSWKKVAKFIKTRTRKQIRSHFQKYFLKLKNKAIKNAKKNKDGNKFVVYKAYRSTKGGSIDAINIGPSAEENSIAKSNSFSKRNGYNVIFNVVRFKNSENPDKIEVEPKPINEFSDRSFKILNQTISAQNELDHEMDINFKIQNDFGFLDDAFEPKESKYNSHGIWTDGKIRFNFNETVLNKINYPY